MRIVRKGGTRRMFAGFLVVTLALTLWFSFSISKEEAATYKLYREDISKEFKEMEKGSGRLFSPSHWMYSLQIRFLDHRTGLDVFLKHPVLGTGILPGEHMVTQHNFHVEWLQCGGVVGYVLFALTIMDFFWRLGPRCRNDKELAITVAAAMAVMLNSLLNGLLHGEIPLLLFTIFGFGMALSEARPAIEATA